MAQYGNIDQLSAGCKYGALGNPLSEPYVANSALGFGKAAFGYQGNADDAVDSFASINTMTYDGVFVSLNNIAFVVNGLSTAVVFTTDQATTMALLIAAIEALDSTFSASFDGLVVTVSTPGADCVISSEVTLGAGQAAGTAGTAALDSTLVFLGAVIKAQKAPTSVGGGTGYLAGESLEVVRQGYLTVVVDAIANCAVNKPVYVITTGDDKGKFTGVAGSNLLLDASFHFLADGTQDLAVVDFQQLPKAVS